MTTRSDSQVRIQRGFFVAISKAPCISPMAPSHLAPFKRFGPRPVVFKSKGEGLIFLKLVKFISPNQAIEAEGRAGNGKFNLLAKK